jgi:hypothetical protein
MKRNRIDHIDYFHFLFRHLNDNQLTGEIPSSIGNLVNLLEL